MLNDILPYLWDGQLLGCPVLRPMHTADVTKVSECHRSEFCWSKDDGGGGDNWSYKMYKAPVKSQPSTCQHSTFYRPDALPITKPTTDVRALKGESITFHGCAHPKLTWTSFNLVFDHWRLLVTFWDGLPRLVNQLLASTHSCTTGKRIKFQKKL